MSLVLVADDEPAVLEILSQVVEDLGHNVVRARDGREALGMIRARPPDLVITDHMMPRLSGLDLIRELKQDPQLKHLRVILLSAALPHGAPEANVFLAKPFELSDFEQRVQDVLAQVAEASHPPAAASPTPEAGSAVMEWIARASRGPIATARLSLEAFERNLSAGPRDARADEHLREVYRQLDRLEGFTRSLEDASQLFEGRLSVEPIAHDLGVVLSRAVQEFRGGHPQVQLELSQGREAVTVKLDPQRATQLLGELLSHAGARAGKTGRVTVTVEVSPLIATVHVQDWGPAMGEEEQKSLFDRMPRRTDKAQAHDLGLFVAAQLARLHGGMLSVRSKAGDGATVSWSIPRA